MAKHTSESCYNRPVKCVDCSATVKHVELDDHKSNHCPERLCTCPLRCSKRVRHKLLTTHQKDECSNRVVSCSQSGCTTKVMFCELEGHITDACPARVACSLSCGKLVVPSRLSSHTNNDCINRPVRCSDCKQSVIAHELPKHRYGINTVICISWFLLTSITHMYRQSACPERLEPCSLGCSAKVKYCDLYKHEQVPLFKLHSMSCP